MSLSREMKSLFQHLKLDFEAKMPAEEKLISAIMQDVSIKKNLEIRLTAAKIVGLIKFIHSLPIFVPEIEQKIINSIKETSTLKVLHPLVSTTFFMVVIEHSKAVQRKLGKLLLDKPNQLKGLLDNYVLTLKQDIPAATDLIDRLRDPKISASDNLKICREIIQNSTDIILSKMASLAYKISSTKKPLILRFGMFGNKQATEMIGFGNKLHSGEVNMRSYNLKQYAY